MSGWSSPITYPLARKRYECAACGLPIAEGQRHARWMWVESGWPHAVTVRAHRLCRALELGWDGEYYDKDGVNNFFEWLADEGVTYGLFTPDEQDEIFLGAVRVYDFLAGLAMLARS